MTNKDTQKEPHALTTVFSVWNTMIGSSMLSLTWAFGNSGLAGGIVVIFVMLLITWYAIYMIMSKRDRELFYRKSCKCHCHSSIAQGSLNAQVWHPEREPNDYAGRSESPLISIVRDGTPVVTAPSGDSPEVDETTRLLRVPDPDRACCECWKPERYTDFMYVCKDYLGEPGRWTAWAGSVITLVGACLVYDILVTTNLYSLVYGIYLLFNGNGTSSSSSVGSSESIAMFNDPFALEADSASSYELTTFEKIWNPTLTPIYFAVFFLPLCCFPRLQSYVRISSFGIVGMLYVVVFILVSSIMNWAPKTVERDYGFKPHATFLAGIMCLAFFVHNFVLQVSERTNSLFGAIRNVSVGFTLGGFSYALLGSITYAALGNNVPQDYFDYFSQTNIFAMTGKIALLFQLCTVLPFIFALLRRQLFAAIFGQKFADYPPFVFTLLYNVVLLTIATLLSIFYPRVGDVLRFTGPVCAVLYVFLLPALVTISYYKRHHRLSALIVIMHILFFCIGVSILAFQFIP